MKFSLVFSFPFLSFDEPTTHYENGGGSVGWWRSLVHQRLDEKRVDPAAAALVLACEIFQVAFLGHTRVDDTTALRAQKLRFAEK
eukprot:scaffold216_cov203-Pinguiococcus_pyrenoidosus.AAC.4